MTIEEIHFVLDSFMHFMPEDEVEDFVRGLVGKRVMLMPNDDNAVDRMCIDGFVGGVVCCHVSARKAALVREYMRRKGARSLMVQVESHNLDKGYKTAFCRVVPDIELNDDFIVEHSRRFLEWKYDGSSNIAWCRHRELWANTDYLLMRLDADDATEEELVPVIEHYVPMLPLAFSKEDKENCIKVNVMLQNSRIAGASEWNAKVVEVLDFLNHSDKRTETVRRWLDDLKLSAVCRQEADGIKATKLEQMTSNLNDFPDGLFACYKRDFVTFCGNLYYNRIPSAKLQEFMNGIAVYELVRERMADHPKKAEKGVGASCYPFVIDQSMAEAVVDRIRSYMQGKDRSQPRDIMMAVRAAQDAGVIRRIRYNEMQEAFPDFCPNSPASVSKYTKEDETPYTDEAFKDMVKVFGRMKGRE